MSRCFAAASWSPAHHDNRSISSPAIATKLLEKKWIHGRADSPHKRSALPPTVKFGGNLGANSADCADYWPPARLLTPLPSTNCRFVCSMAWKRSSVRSRPGPPSFQSLTEIVSFGLVAFGSKLLTASSSFFKRERSSQRNRQLGHRSRREGVAEQRPGHYHFRRNGRDRVRMVKCVVRVDVHVGQSGYFRG